MEVRLVDPYSDPPGLTEAWNTERLVRLPETAWCYQPSVEAVASDYEPPVSRQGRVTFGSFNALCKISDACLRGWAEILQRVPDSRLLVKNYALQDLEGREAFQRRALLQGVPIERVDLLGVLPGYLHYQAYRMVDIMLDTYPYHGTTTTCEALWMGVPVVTLAGKFHVSRVGASLLHQVQADDLIATSPEEYIALAVTLAGDPNRIRDYHQTLRKRMQQSPLTNAPRFARNFEACIESLLGC
jgi:predicted O-linked N-acetylglucosamine transferase (SPINDLY family)